MKAPTGFFRRVRYFLRLSTRFFRIDSLFGEILWMLLPLLFLWPISIVVTHHFANQVANQPYDQALAENVRAIARLARTVEGRATIELPAAAQSLLQTGESDRLYYQVLDDRGGLLAGDRLIPRIAPKESAENGNVQFRDDTINGETVRVAWQYFAPTPRGAPLLIQVAETHRQREQLASRIVSGVILPQFALIPLAVLLVYLGLTRGIAPLTRLQHRISHRRPGDLAPIGIHGVPEEVRPVVIAFNEMMARLENNLQSQQRFIADAAHQMRTPLTGLKMQIELAMAENDPQSMRMLLKGISESSERAIHLINQLLLLARAEASHEKLHVFETVDLEKLAREATQDAVPRALLKDIDLGFEDSGWPLLIDGSPLLLHELMSNLIDNAIKYTPRGGRVTVRTRAGAFALFEVEDNGCGISEAERALVFERFYRVLGSDASGSGLGLPIVRRIAELHRASVQLRPSPAGQGTLAQAIFPRQAVGDSLQARDDLA